MKGEEKQNDQELLEVDDEGNIIEKKEEKKDKPSNIYKYFLLIIAIIILLGLAYFFFCKNKNNKSVFDETKLKNLKLKSRVFNGPVFDYTFVNGKYKEEGLKRYETLAKNNIALFVTEGMTVGDYFPSPLKDKEILRIDTDEYIEEYKKVTDIVHKYNSYILLQMAHAGLLSISDTIYSPSGDKGFFNNVTSKEMTKEDILRIQDYHVQAAKRAIKAGFDGIEIHGAQLTLVSQFLSSKFNRRNDEYGGSEEKRTRFVVEIVKKIREAIGDNKIISIKIDCEDENNGFTESGFLTTGKKLEEAGVDMISVSGTTPIKDGELYFYDKTKKLAEILKIPVVYIGGVKTYENADYVLKNSKIEYVSMVRELMKDPELVTKWNQNK